MSERGSSIERVVGGIDDEDKQDIQRQYNERFREQAFDDLYGLERDKTPEEQKIIQFVDDATDTLRKQYGLEAFPVPEKNVHVIPRDHWKPTTTDAFFLPQRQAVFVREAVAPIVFAKKIYHEFVHFKSYGAAQVRRDTDKVDLYRQGLRVYARGQEELFFRLLNEAVTEELAKRWLGSNQDAPLLEQDSKETARVKESIQSKRKHRTPTGKLDNIYYLSEKITQAGSGVEVAMCSEEFSNTEERRALGILIEKIVERNPDRFQNREQAFAMFAQAMLDGNLLSLGKTIDQTFGQGTFRAIGEARDGQTLSELADRL